MAEADRGIAATDGAWRQRFQLLKCELLLFRGDVKRADALLQGKDLAAPRTPPLEARKRMLAGYVLWKQQRLEEAEAALAVAARLAKESRATDVAAETAMVRGRVATTQQRLKDTEQFYRQAFEFAKETGDAYQQAAALLNIGVLEIYRYRHDYALPILQRSFILASQANAPLIRAAATGNIALCYSRLGNYELAIEARRQSLEIHRQAGIRQHVATALGELGTIYLDQDEPGEAAKYFREAVVSAQEIKSKSDETAYTCYLAAALLDAGDVPEAERLNDAATRLATETKDIGAQHRALFTSARLAQRHGDNRRAIADYMRLVNDPAVRPALLWSAHAGLARIYSSTGQRTTARRHYEEALATITRKRSELLRTDYKLGFLSSLIRFYREYVDDLIRSGDSLQALGIAESSRAQLLSARTRIDVQTGAIAAPREWTSIAAASNGVILSYWLGPQQSRLWLITPTGVRRFDLPGSKPITALVESYRQAIEHDLRQPLASPASPGRDLYRILIEPAAAFIPRGANVFVVPDGALHNLNFETLIAAVPEPHYWLEDVTVAIAPSVTALAKSGRTPSDAGSVLLIGDPVTADSAFEKLPYAAAEIGSIAKRLGSVKPVVRTGAQATPAAFFQVEPQRFSVIHFAAHALANRESPLDSAIILSPEAGDYKLYSRDIANTSLRADLVTISGCRSAGGRAFSGEGLVGFAWAFLLAGARNVVAGLWDVSDRSTSELMDRMYEEIARGATPAAALKRAKVAFVRGSGNYRKPYYWAAFQLYTRDEASHPLYASQKTYSH